MSMSEPAAELVELIDADHPWPGLLPFPESAAAFFHGRDAVADELFRMVAREPLTVLFGQSGLGKSSLLNAGLFPRLRAAGYLPVYLRLNHDLTAPLLLAQAEQALAAQCARHALDVTPPDSDESLWHYLHRSEVVFRTLYGRSVTPVLVFDQFEEIFTLGRQSEDHRARSRLLIAQLGELIDNRVPPALEQALAADPTGLERLDLFRCPVKILLSFREDYLAEFEELKTHIRAISFNRLRLGPMTGAQARTALCRAGGPILDEPVAEGIVRFVAGAAKDSRSLAELRVEPALLSLVCRDLNQQRLATKAAQISAAQLDRDNADQIVERFYDAAFAGLDPRLRDFVEDALLTRAGNRDSCALDNALSKPGVDEAALQSLVERRLLRREERESQVRLELIHDLLTATARASRARRHEREALDDARRQLARQRRRQRLASGAGLLLFLLVVGVSWLAITARDAAREAQRQQQVATARLAEAQRAQARFLTKEAEGKPPEEARPILLAAMPSDSAAPVPDRATTPEAMAALAASVTDTRLRAVLPHLGVVTHAAFSPDGRRVVTATSDGMLVLWDAERADALWTLSAPGARFPPIAFSPDGRQIVGLISDTTAQLVDAQTGNPLADLVGHQGAIISATFSRDGRQIVTASRDKTARLWDTATGRLLRVLEGHQGDVYAAAFSPDGTRVVTASDDKTARLWTVADGQLLATLAEHQEPVRSAEFSPNGRFVVTSSADATARLWDAQSGQAEILYRGHSGMVWQARFSPDGSQLATASDDGTARIWDVASGETLRILGDQNEKFWSIAYSANGSEVVTTSEGGAAQLWDAATGARLARFAGARDSRAAVAVSPDGRRVTTGRRNQLTLWDTRHSLSDLVLSGHMGGLHAAEFSPDGRRVVTASADKTAKLWDATTGMSLATLNGHIGDVRVAKFGADGRRVITVASTDHAARLWDGVSGQFLTSLDGHSAQTRDAAFDPDGRRLATASWDGTARIWDGESGQRLRVLTGHSGGVVNVAFSADGTRLITESIDGTARLWDAQTGQTLTTLGGRFSPINFVRLSPDGRFALTTNFSGTKIDHWQIENGKYLSSAHFTDGGSISWFGFTPDGRRVVLALTGGHVHVVDFMGQQAWMTLTGHQAAVRDVSFSPDGAWMVTASDDRTVRLWNAMNGQLHATLSGHGDRVRSVKVSQDGRRVLTASFDKTARLWRLPDYGADLLDYARAITLSDLSSEQRAKYFIVAENDRVNPSPSDRPADESASAACDRVAGHPHDPQRVGVGVYFESLTPDSVEICRKAVAANPRIARLRYQLGRTLSKAENDAAALIEFRQSAAADYPMGFFALGMAYETGQGVEKDLAAAERNYRRAFDAGVMVAATALAQQLWHGEAGRQDRAAALQLWRRAAAAGDFSAHEALARALERGQAVEADRIAALTHWTIAERLQDARGADTSFAAARRVTLAHSLPIADAARAWRAAQAWRPSP